MIRVCYSKHHLGPRVFGEKPPYEDKSLTSGICEECLPKDIEDLNEWRHKMKVALEDGAKNPQEPR